ncbi:uncharacterized protein LOC120847359 isoform X2 [Ixodes scapularis]|uniref:uncharacterized protein LOC120847359 isoform X2 n=1 Tax=Ixodes scapularis TaxID=6945 RepID=UPI001A9ED701|nr:uncharacterized protein LOC120847359 isoform X2 [Ixodes scapularis]
MNAIQKVLPDTKCHRCLFHLGHAIYKHVQEYKLQPQYNRDKSFATSVRMLTALAFLPYERIRERFAEKSRHTTFTRHTALRSTGSCCPYLSLIHCLNISGVEIPALHDAKDGMLRSWRRQP